MADGYYEIASRYIEVDRKRNKTKGGLMKINYEEYLLNLFNEITKISNEKASIRNCLKIKVLTDVISSIYLIMSLKKGQ